MFAVCQICNLLSAMNDEDLRQDCRITLTNLSSSLLTPDILPAALVTIKEVASEKCIIQVSTIVKLLLGHV